jgi:hypothetical protein
MIQEESQPREGSRELWTVILCVGEAIGITMGVHR